MTISSSAEDDKSSAAVNEATAHILASPHSENEISRRENSEMRRHGQADEVAAIEALHRIIIKRK